MQLQISTLQSQLTLLQHQNRPEQPIPTNGADVASCISELRAGLHAIKSVVAATPPPASASATASVWQMPLAPVLEVPVRTVMMFLSPHSPLHHRLDDSLPHRLQPIMPRLLVILAILSPLMVAGPPVVGPGPRQDPHRQAPQPQDRLRTALPVGRVKGLGLPVSLRRPISTATRINHW